MNSSTPGAEANQRFFDNLLSRYHVTVQPYSPDGAAGPAAAGKVAMIR